MLTQASAPPRLGSFALPLRCWHEDAGAKFHHQFWAAASGCARSVLRLVLELDGEVVERADPISAFVGASKL